jgi:glycosyltransferase involved in cell wall biosynthesis
MSTDPDHYAARGLPLVSVVVASNRASPFLVEALNSVAAQTYPHLEIIVVDDGSDDPEFITDVTRSMSEVTVVRQRPSGVAVARNVGAALATGEFLVFLDDDDRWHPERIQLQLRAFENAPDAVACYCGMQSIDEAGNVVAEADQVAVSDEYDVARRATGIILPNVLMRRTAFERVGGFHPAIRLAQDLDLILLLARQGRFVFSPEVLVDYRAHSNNNTRRYRELCRSISEVVHLHLWNAIERNDDALASAYRESLLSNQRFAWWSAIRAARTSLARGHAGSAIGDVAWAIRFAPGGPPSAALRRLRHVK